MGKRQIILKSEELDPKFVGEEVNIEDLTLKVWHGYLTGITPDAIKFRDTRQKEHTMKRGDVRRVFLERITEY
jgi:hypothetical protein